jgi:hypothetical protein
VRDLLIGDFLAVHLEHTGTALAKAGLVGLEVVDDGVLARCQDLIALPTKAPFKAKEVVEGTTGLPLSR